MKRSEVLDIMELAISDYLGEKINHPDILAEVILKDMEKAGLYYKKETIECHVDGVKYVYTEEKLGND